jgi:hypothetical protein
VSEPRNRLDAELRTYEALKDELLQRCEGKYVLIHGDTIAGAYGTKLDAVGAGHQQFGTGPFLVKRVERVEKPVYIFLPRG